MTDQPGEDQIEFIDAQADAAIRLECIRLTQSTSDDFASHMDHARTIYNWVMGLDESDDVAETELTAESAPACTRKH
jgi:hypothetical protein